MDPEIRREFEYVKRTIDRTDRNVRSVKQTVDEVLKPTIDKHSIEIEKLKSRFVYALTVIGTAVGTALYLATRSPTPSP